MDSVTATEGKRHGAERREEREQRALETDSTSRPDSETASSIDSADLAVGILGGFGRDGFPKLCEGLRALAGSLRIAVLQTEPFAAQTVPGSGANGGPSLFFVPLVTTDVTGAPAVSMAAAYQSVFAAAERLQARACCIFASQIEGATSAWVADFARSLLEEGVDLVLPRYARHKFEGLLNVSIISPLMRSLYGKRIQNPMGPDLGISRQLFRPLLVAEQKGGGGGVHALASLASSAICGNLRVSEMYAGARAYRPTDWGNLSSLLSAVLGPLFAEMERNAACWQRVRGSAHVPVIGEPGFVAQDAESLDVHRMVESFQLGNRELQEIWSLVLPPATLFELRKLLRLPAEQFHMDDALWARIVYDFALAHRLRTISRDHLLRSMTPLYLGWVASYALGMQGVAPEDVERRIERLGLAYEAAKPYLLSRWRWPDRFSP
jgi:glucosylglycerate synthase